MEFLVFVALVALCYVAYRMFVPRTTDQWRPSWMPAEREVPTETPIAEVYADSGQHATAVDDEYPSLDELLPLDGPDYADIDAFDERWLEQLRKDIEDARAARTWTSDKLYIAEDAPTQRRKKASTTKKTAAKKAPTKKKKPAAKKAPAKKAAAKKAPATKTAKKRPTRRASRKSS
jgi:hypothetical protein